MYSFIDIQKKLLPELIAVMQKRYHILQYIGFMQPVGRRSLASSLGFTERVLRSEVEFFKGQGLIHITSVGMSLTSDGREILVSLERVMREVTGISEIESNLVRELGIKQAIIVAGDSDDSPWVKNELGLACAKCMKSHLLGNNIIAVNGGSTMATVAAMLKPDFTDHDLLFVPARGGIGEDVENQANTICAKMAHQTDSKHRVLYAPDQVSKEMYRSIIKEPNIQEVLMLIKSASMVIHGIGDAIKMAERRKTPVKDLEKIQRAHAVGEAFGYYFNEDGEVVHRVQTIGLQLEELMDVEHVIAVAGGASKAKAIKAYLKQAPSNTILITDEGAAQLLI